MATLPAASKLTILDIVQREKPDHTPAVIADILTLMNPALQDIVFVPCNDGTQHIVHQRTKLPTAQVLRVGEGIPVDRSNVSQYVDTTSLVGLGSSCNKRVLDMNGNSAAHRASEARATIEAINQKVMDQWFYGDSSTDPKSIDGLAKRYSSLSAANAEHIIDAGGTSTDNASMWMVINSPYGIHGLYPKGTEAGLKHTPLNGGKPVPVTYSNGNLDEEYQDVWEWHQGVSVYDWRCAVRIANIDISNLVTNSTPADLLLLMIKAYHRIQRQMNVGTPSIYVNSTIAQYLDIQARDKLAGNFTYETVDGQPKMSFRGMAIRTVDALRENEARVT